MRNLTLVYFVWVNPLKDYLAIISGQLSDMVDSGILDVARVCVVVSCHDPNLTGGVVDLVRNAVRSTHLQVEVDQENFYEYNGIRKLWESSIGRPDDLYIYMHAKGMSDVYNNVSSRHPYEVFLTRRTLKFATTNMFQIFEENQEIMKAGLFPSKHHLPNDYIWLNFYIARGSYLQSCEEPVVSPNRYYYETWSGTGHQNNCKSVYNFYENNFRKYFLNEVGDILNLETG